VFILIQSIPINMKVERNLEDRLNTQKSQITFWKDQEYWYFAIINAIYTNVLFYYIDMKDDLQVLWNTLYMNLCFQRKSRNLILNIFFTYLYLYCSFSFTILTSTRGRNNVSPPITVRADSLGLVVYRVCIYNSIKIFMYIFFISLWYQCNFVLYDVLF